MKRTSTDVVVSSNHDAKFAKVFDKRKQPIRGLWQRNDRYYAQLSFESDTGEKKVRRVPLLDDEQQPVVTLAQAQEALSALKTDRNRDALPVLHRTPKLKDFIQTYLKAARAGNLRKDEERQKEDSTIDKEEGHLNGWTEHMGAIRLDRIRKSHVLAYRTKRLEAGMSNRTCNLDLSALNNVLNHAVDCDHIKVLPTANVRRLRVNKTERPLFTASDLNKLCAAALATKKDGEPVTKNGAQFVDYLHFLAYSGCREKEALWIRWQDVDFSRQLVLVGVVKRPKNREPRRINFNPKLAELLRRMKKRRAPDSQWLFPSPQRGDKDIHAKTFRESLKQARTHAKMPHIAFHDLRHHFISYCVMSGIDYMSIAAWVGHKDGGVLIGKTYGHLADDHKKAMAAKVNFGPQLVEAREAAQ